MVSLNDPPAERPIADDIAAWAAELDGDDPPANAGDRALSKESLIAWARTEADGWRHVHPDKLGTLTATEARAQLRAENGPTAETPAEAEAAADLLAAAAGSPEEATAARAVPGTSITRAEAAALAREPSTP